jgi:hypothetical protein
VLVCALAVGGVAATTAAAPLADNAATSDRLGVAYEPLDREFERALVLLPTPLGDWLNHPFQATRNTPDYDGPAVYALGEAPFAVADAFPNRTLYRYAYRGAWRPQETAVQPTLRRVRLVGGERVRVSALLGVPTDASVVSARLAADGETAYFTGDADGDSVALELAVTDGRATLAGGVTPLAERSVAIDERTEIDLAVFVERGPTRRVTYRLRVPVDPTADGVRVLSPDRDLCTRPLQCGEEGSAYVSGAGAEWVRFETRVGAE